MNSSRSTGHRVVALAIAATLIEGGRTEHHGHAIVVITSDIAIVAGLGFLRMARRR
jgi:hypothetical protein